MSGVRVKRCARAKPSVGSGAGVLAGEANRQALAALPPPAAENFAAPLGLHASAETMRPDAALVAGAIRRLTHTDSEPISEKWGEREGM